MSGCLADESRTCAARVELEAVLSCRALNGEEKYSMMNDRRIHMHNCCAMQIVALRRAA